MNGLPEIKLRAPEISDADFMFEVENDREAWIYSDTVAPLSRRLLRDYAMDYDADPFRAGQLRLIITDCHNSRPVGIADLYDISQRHLKAFCAVYVIPGFRGIGVATAAILNLVAYCREVLMLNRLFAYISEDNHASERVFLKAGFSQQALIEEWTRSRDGFSSARFMSLKL